MIETVRIFVSHIELVAVINGSITCKNEDWFQLDDIYIYIVQMLDQIK